MASPSVPQQQPTQPFGRLGTVTDTVVGTVLNETPLWWWIAFGVSAALGLVFVVTMASIALIGTGLWGINIPVVWGMGIVNLIFWIGIGHAGTFISAFLLLMRRHWRTAFSRYAEAMTLFALAVAGVFPLLHVGRPEWIFYFAPYPNTMILNPQWLSPLVWDAIAISVYGLISGIFWFLDLLPDLAALRDKAKQPFVRLFYSALSMGWRGDAAHWEKLHKVAFLLAALATPLVISVHSVVGLDFAISNVPGWHHTIFPPYFVAGAVYSGLAMVIIVGVLIMRSGLGLQQYVTRDKLDKAARLMLVTGLLVGYGYAAEAFGAFYKQDVFEVASITGRAFGPYAPYLWGMIILNIFVPQLLWVKSIRRNLPTLVIICIGILAGMWLERFVIVSMSLTYSYMPSVWAVFQFNIVDILTLFSPFGFFFALFLLFVRFFPVLPISETQQQLAVPEGH